jgi:hypothetical protein
MLRCAPHVSLITRAQFYLVHTASSPSWMSALISQIKSPRSSLTKHAIPSDGIERALTPSPGRRSQSAGSEGEADKEDNEAANESQLSRREMIGMSSV